MTHIYECKSLTYVVLLEERCSAGVRVLDTGQMGWETAVVSQSHKPSNWTYRRI